MGYGSALVAGNVRDSRLQQSLGHGEYAFAVKFLPFAQVELLDFLLEKPLGHFRLNWFSGFLTMGILKEPDAALGSRGLFRELGEILGLNILDVKYLANPPVEEYISGRARGRKSQMQTRFAKIAVRL